MDLLIILTFLSIPLLAGIIITIFKNKIKYRDLVEINIFTSMALLIYSIYSLCYFCIEQNNIEDSTNIIKLTQNTKIFEIQNYILIDNNNTILLIGLSIILFCISLFPNKALSKIQTIYKMFFTFGIYGCIISNNTVLLSIFLIITIICFCLIIFKKIELKKIIIPSISILTIIIILITNKFIKNEFIVFPLFFLATFILSGFPFTDKWLTENDIKTGNEIFSITSFGKLGIMIFFKFITIFNQNIIKFYLPLIIILGISCVIIKTILSIKEKNFQTISINYLEIHSALLFISIEIFSHIIFICIILSIFTGIITQTALLFSATIIKIKAPNNDNNIFINQENSFFISMLIITCLSALFIPGTATFIPYIFMLETATEHSALLLIFLLLYPISSEIYLYKIIQPMLQKGNTPSSNIKKIEPQEQIGLLLMNFVLIAIGIFPSIILQPILLIKILIS